jgi:DNA mismatch repair protein MutH
MGASSGPRPPTSEAELLRRAERLAGRTLAEIAGSVGRPVPTDPRRAKGWAGRLLETWLGATAGSLAEPDFQALGVELKTLPVDREGRPLESTYVCTVPLSDACRETWARSWVRRKLARVLWVPVEGSRDLALRDRRVGTPLLWSLESDLETVLRADWEDLMERICLGRIGEVSARLGTYLQVRPKAASSRVLQRAVGEDGGAVSVNPRGFYLRPSFTREVLRRHYALPP